MSESQTDPDRDPQASLEQTQPILQVVPAGGGEFAFQVLEASDDGEDATEHFSVAGPDSFNSELGKAVDAYFRLLERRAEVAEQYQQSEEQADTPTPE